MVCAYTELTNLRVNHIHLQVNMRVTLGSGSRKKHLKGIIF